MPPKVISEDVADILGNNYNPPIRDMDDPIEARRRLRVYLDTRLTDILQLLPNRPIVMLSGGIDSTTLAAALTSLQANPICVTVTAQDIATADQPRAMAVATSLHLDHIPIELSTPEIVRSAVEAADVLGTDEIWEIGAAVVTRAAFDVVTGGGAIFSGAGADVLFAGGMTLEAPLRSNTARLELCDRIWRNVQTEFSKQRLIPDFYQRLLPHNDESYVKIFQTVDAWKLTADFSPTVLFTEHPKGGLVDKSCLRDLAVELGVERKLVWEPQTPMQRSAGIFEALAHYGREQLATDPAANTYSNPLNEPAETVIARMGLREAIRSRHQ